MDIINHKRSRLFCAATAVLFSMSVFSLTAFATNEIPSQGQPITNGTTSAQHQTIDDAPHPPDVPSSAITPSNGGQVDPGTPSSDGNSHPSSSPEGQNSSHTNGNSEISSESSHTASSETQESQIPEEPKDNQSSSRHSSQGRVSSKPSVPVKPPAGVASARQDSRAPTDFTSDDLKGLLSGGENSLASTDGFLREDTPTNATTSTGGTSNLLLGGIALILVGVAGVVYFVYRQFFIGKRRPTQMSTTGPIPAIPATKPLPKKPTPKPTPSGTLEQQSQGTPEDTSHGQYTDISSGRTSGPDSDGFDWDQFFRNNPPDDSTK